MSKTIEEIKDLKTQAEKDIIKILKKVEKDAELSISRIRTSIDSYSYEEREESRKNGKKSLRKLKGVMDVVIEMNISNDPRSIDY